MPENQAVLFGGLILGVLRILLFQGRAESPMERVALSLQMKAAQLRFAAFICKLSATRSIGLSARLGCRLP